MKRSNVAVRAQRNQPPSLSRDTWVGTLVATHCEANGEWEALHALRFGQRHHSAARLVAESRGGLWNFGISLQVKTQASDSHEPRGNAASFCFFPLSPWSHFSRNNNCVSLEKQTRHHWRTVNCMHGRHQSPF